MQNRQFDLDQLADTCPYQQHHKLLIECALDRPAKVGKEYSLYPLFQAMRIRVPVDGMEYDRVIAQVSGPGFKLNEIEAHEHPEHVVLYYVEPASAVVIDGQEYRPAVGQFLYVAPGVRHAVLKSTERRVVLAMLVS